MKVYEGLIPRVSTIDISMPLTLFQINRSRNVCGRQARETQTTTFISKVPRWLVHTFLFFDEEAVSFQT